MGGRLFFSWIVVGTLAIFLFANIVTVSGVNVATASEGIAVGAMTGDSTSHRNLQKKRSKRQPGGRGRGGGGGGAGGEGDDAFAGAGRGRGRGGKPGSGGGGGGRGDGGGGRGAGGGGGRGGMDGVKDPVMLTDHLPLTLAPKNFSTAGLPSAEHVSPYSKVYDKEGKYEATRDTGDASRKLCVAAFQRDLAGVKYLLHDLGVSPNLGVDKGRNAFHCLAFTYMNTEKVGILGNTEPKDTWLHETIKKKYTANTKVYSMLMREVMDADEQKKVVETAMWLARAGCDINHKDTYGVSPMHVAAAAGLTELVDFFVRNGAKVGSVNNQGRLAIHNALVYGHVDTAAVLFKAKSDMTLADENGVTPTDLLANPGAIAAKDAKEKFGIKQRKSKRIDRVLHPELHAKDMRNGSQWSAGTGGWGTERLKGFETDMACDGVDQYWAHEVDADMIFKKYLARNMPFMIRGAIEDWNLREVYKADTLKKLLGHMDVTVSDVPYTQKFGNDAFIQTTLGAYIDKMRNHKVDGGNHPWYIFMGNKIPDNSESKDSPVKFKDAPTPDFIQFAFEKFVPDGTYGKRGQNDEVTRAHFTNAQWAVGVEGSGAPVHFHNYAWNAVVYGAKKWLLYPPHDRILSNRQILQFVQDGDMELMEQKGARRIDCVQTAGDILVVPENWGHGVLNIQESIAMATEISAAIWRQSPMLKTAKQLGAIRN